MTRPYGDRAIIEFVCRCRPFGTCVTRHLQRVTKMSLTVPITPTVRCHIVAKFYVCNRLLNKACSMCCVLLRAINISGKSLFKLKNRMLMWIMRRSVTSTARNIFFVCHLRWTLTLNYFMKTTENTSNNFSVESCR